ncbi:MAG: hypothetical protein JJD97_01715 [Gemmatimonadaceae bacterium]|nr:hypothetical protein [Gemmatimonadaceae bacterium]
MWADTLQTLEQQHYLKLVAWGGISVLIGTLLLIVLRLSRARGPLLSHFAAQCAVWGAAALLWGGYAYQRVPLRDYDSAGLLARRLWLAIALEAGGIVVGATFAWFGWSFGRRFGAVGTGIGVVVQSAGLLALDLMLVRVIQL